MPNNLQLTEQIANMNTNMIVVFDGEDIIVSNTAFNKFFGVASPDEYKSNFGTLVNNFIPHPSYFHAQKVEDGDNWFNAILKLDEIARVVSFISQTLEPHAFSVSINQQVENLNIVSFEDITQDLIKRIMIENKANIDTQSGAYTKQYFLQIKKSYEEAALFNKKIIGLITIEMIANTTLSQEDIKTLVSLITHSIRQDDMLVKWTQNKFLLAYLTDEVCKTKQIEKKLQNILKNCTIKDFSYSFDSIVQIEKESIATLLSKLSS